MKVLSIKDDATAEIVVNKSKFIAFALKAEDEQAVQDSLKRLRKTYYDATHVCYAAVWDESGNAMRSSDDGEPSGTAGMPILSVILGRNLRKTMVAVVRYFGGVKLGTGGLTRAYSAAAQAALDKSGVTESVLCDKYLCKTDFVTFRKIASTKGIADVVYGDGVKFSLYVPQGESIKGVINKACGRLDAEKSGEQYINFS